MAVNRVPVLKRCRSLDLDPTFLGYDKTMEMYELAVNEKYRFFSFGDATLLI